MEADVEKVPEELMATLLPFQVCIFHSTQHSKFAHYFHARDAHRF